jgi:tetratricopeptide (TPR) repeat protein
MGLMASAYLRSGSRELAGEMLSLAVEASNNAPEESLRYAAFLLENENYSVAEPILVNALRLSPNNVPVLIELGRVYLGQQDWARLEQVEATLRRLETDETTAAADSLRVARLQSQDRTDEAISVLQSILQEQGSNGGAEFEIVRTHLQAGDVAAAESFVDGMLAENPQNDTLRLLRAAIFEATERSPEAEKVYQEMLTGNPGQETVWRALYALQAREGRFEEARATLERGLEAIPDAPNLQWALAGEYEREGNIDSAIGIYEALYERDTNSIIIANNLASLISTYRTDQESLDRAWSIARRLRGADRPEFQDTYGWIALRRGEVEEALAHLEPAAAALSGDPLVQFHLGMAYARAERRDDAIRQLRRAIELAGPADTRPQFEEARQEIARLEAVPETAPAD